MSIVTKAIFDILFDEGDYIIYGNLFCRTSTKIMEWCYEGGSYTQWDKNGKVMKMQHGSHILLNSVRPNTTRKVSNIAKFRSFLLESDSLSVEDQKILIAHAIKYYRLPISYSVFSGKSSIHSVITVEVPLSSEENYINTSSNFLSFEEYHSLPDIFSNIHERLVERMNQITRELMYKGIIKKTPPNKYGDYFDRSVKDCSRLSRFPNAKPNTKSFDKKEKGRKTQSVIYVHRRITVDEFKSFLKTCPVVNFYKEKENLVSDFLSFDNVLDLNNFYDTCTTSVRKKIDFFKKNSTESEMHQHIRGLFLTLFKEYKTLTEEQALNIAEDFVFPHLLEAGYDQKKLYHNTTISWAFETARNI